MEKIIIDRIEQFKLDEDNFKSDWWENNYVSLTLNGKSETKHISDVDFEALNDDDLVRIFEYIILCKSDISTRRVNETYFKSSTNKIKIENVLLRFKVGKKTLDESTKEILYTQHQI